MNNMFCFELCEGYFCYWLFQTVWYSRDPNKRTGGNRRTGEKLDQELINVQEVINVQGRKTSLIK